MNHLAASNGALELKATSKTDARKGGELDLQKLNLEKGTETICHDTN